MCGNARGQSQGNPIPSHQGDTKAMPSWDFVYPALSFPRPQPASSPGKGFNYAHRNIYQCKARVRWYEVWLIGCTTAWRLKPWHRSRTWCLQISLDPSQPMRHPKTSLCKGAEMYGNGSSNCSDLYQSRQDSPPRLAKAIRYDKLLQTCRSCTTSIASPEPRATAQRQHPSLGRNIVVAVLRLWQSAL